MKKDLAYYKRRTARVLARRKHHIKRTVAALLVLEEKQGWTAIMSAFKGWVNKPKRGRF